MIGPMPDRGLLVNGLHAAVRGRTQLALESIALRYGMATYKCSVKQPNTKDGD